MSALRQKEKPSAAGTAKGKGVRPGRRVPNKNHRNHDTTPARRRQRFFRKLRKQRPAAAVVAFLLLLGIVGGMERETIGLGSGIAAMAATALAFAWLMLPYLNVPLGKEER